MWRSACTCRGWRGLSSRWPRPRKPPRRRRGQSDTPNDILAFVTLGELARRLECPVEGDAAIEIRRVAKIEDAGPGDLTFLANPKYASKLATTKASAVIVNGEDMAAHRGYSGAVIRSSSPYLTLPGRRRCSRRYRRLPPAWTP